MKFALISCISPRVEGAKKKFFFHYTLEHCFIFEASWVRQRHSNASVRVTNSWAFRAFFSLSLFSLAREWKRSETILLNIHRTRLGLNFTRVLRFIDSEFALHFQWASFANATPLRMRQGELFPLILSLTSWISSIKGIIVISIPLECVVP